METFVLARVWTLPFWRVSVYAGRGTAKYIETFGGICCENHENVILRLVLDCNRFGTLSRGCAVIES